MDRTDSIAARMAKRHGLDWDEVCALEANPDGELCGSGTCIAAHHEDHDPAVCRDWYRDMAISAVETIGSWNSVETAPRDGSIFIAFSPDTGLDFAQYDPRTHEFMKWGCGWQFVTLWHPAPDMPALSPTAKGRLF